MDGNYWKYDNFGRLKSIPGMITSQTYEADGQTNSITYANNVTTSFTYSPERRWVLSIVTRNPLGASAVAGVAPYVYTYPAGSGVRPPTLILYGERRLSPRLEPC